MPSKTSTLQKVRPRPVQGNPPALIAIVQVLLRVNVTGTVDKRTAAVLNKYRHKMGLKDGGVDVKFIQRYLEGHGAVRMGAQGSAVQIVQYIVGVRADGHFGPVTLEAVVKMQRANGVKPTGVFGPESVKRLII